MGPVQPVVTLLASLPGQSPSCKPFSFQLIGTSAPEQVWHGSGLLSLLSGTSYKGKGTSATQEALISTPTSPLLGLSFAWILCHPKILLNAV